MNATEIRVHNYRTTLDQAQRYLALALGSAVGVWLLRESPSTTRVTIPGTFVEVGLEMARVLLVGFHIVVAALACYTVETGVRLASELKPITDIASAMYYYPSIPCSPWPGVRLAVPIMSMILVGWSQLHRATAFGMGDVLVLIFLLSVHGTLIGYLWLHPSGKLNPWIKGLSD